MSGLSYKCIGNFILKNRENAYFSGFSDTYIKSNPYTVYIGFCDYGYSGQSGYSDHNLVDGPPSLHNSDLGYNDLQFSLLYSEIATVNPFGGR